MAGARNLVAKLLPGLWPVLAPCLVLVAVWLLVQGGGVVLQREATLALVYVVLVVGLYSFAGTSGILSFGHMSFMAIGAYVTALITIPVGLKSSLLPELPGFIADTELAPLVAALIAGGIAALFGLILSIPLMRLSGIAAALSMFAVLLVVHDVASNWTEVTRGRQTMLGVPTNTTLTAALLWAIAMVVGVYLFQRSRFGLRLRAARDDPVVAQSCGIDVTMERRIAFVLSAFIVGLGGFLYAQFLGTFTPESFFVSITFITIAMLVVGGQYSLGGAVVGAIVFSALSTGLLRLEQGAYFGPVYIDVGAGLHEVGLAIVLLAILILRPDGLMRGREFGWPPQVYQQARKLTATLRRRGRGEATVGPSDASM